MAEKTDELKRLQVLLQKEKEEDFEQYKRKVQKLPISKRKEKGLSWYPVQAIKRGFTYGERVFIVVARKEGDVSPHQFSAGKTVSLFTEQPGATRPARSGVVNYVDKNKMKIILNSTDAPEWLNGGLLGVDLLFDERSYKEMEKALKMVMNAKGDRLAEIRDIFLNKLVPKYHEVPAHLQIPSLNEHQLSAVKDIIASRDVAIIHGPPGTGKTTTLVQAIRQLCKTEKTVLVCAPSNAAVDVLTERLADMALNVVRVGNVSRVDESIIRHSLEVRMSKHPESKNIKKVKLQAAEARRKAQRYKRNFGRKERAERQQYYQEAKDLTAWVNQLEDRLLNAILDSAEVITCTLVSASNPALQNRRFRTVVIDEAAQALEPASWIPITKASKVVLTGDPFQLPPTVKSVEARKGGLHISLLEKCLEKALDSSFLRTQYRMHRDIMGFSNQQFYEGRLLADASVAQWQLTIEDTESILFIDTAGCGFEETLNPQSMSRYNPGEFNILREHLLQLMNTINGHEPPSIAIISPYKEQVIHIRQQIEEDESLQAIDLHVGTIDGFQGQERDVIYLSLVRSNNKSEIGFLSDYRRMNVAMTRARKKLIMVGDSATVGTDEFYAAFLEYCERLDAYKSAWEFMQ
ncbi:MAG: AAA domain-containing protein [Bacteroidota bacterium]